jgi:hypothetical protein
MCAKENMIVQSIRGRERERERERERVGKIEGDSEEPNEVQYREVAAEIGIACSMVVITRFERQVTETFIDVGRDRRNSEYVLSQTRQMASAECRLTLNGLRRHADCRLLPLQAQASVCSCCNFYGEQIPQIIQHRQAAVRTDRRF